MKKTQLKIRAILLIILVAILGTLSILYISFCRDDDYNKAPIETTTVPETTEEPITSPPVTEAPNQVESEPDESVTDTPIVWDDYNPSEMLASDKWMLTLINKNHPLDKSYSPTTAPVIEGSSVTADVRVSEAYRAMYNAAAEDGIILTPYSGYCGYQRQKTIYEDKIQAFLTQGLSEEEAKANTEKRVEPAGCSENGAGLSVDVLSASTGFSETDAYKWLVENAHNYGFILRYPNDKTEITGMIYQPWHWRYVGVDAAVEMKSNNLCLEEYLGDVNN